MKIKRFRWLLLPLSVLMLSACSLTLPSDNSAEATVDMTTESAEATATTDTTPSGVIPVPELLKLWEKKGLKYTIIYNEQDENAKELSYLLFRKFRSLTTASLGFATDKQDFDYYEILLGNTNRPESDCSKELKENEYGVIVKGHKVVLQASDPALLLLAVDRFLETVTVENTMVTLPSTTRSIGMATAKATLKVASYNIKNGAVANHDFKLLAQDILDIGADVVGLQEVDQLTKRNGYQDTLKLLSEYTGMRYYQFLPTISPYQNGEYGIAVLSKYPIVSHSYEYLPKYASKDEQRGALCVEIDVNGTTVNFVSTHCHWDGFEEQLRTIAKMVEEKPNYIVVGDLNNSDFALHRKVFPTASIAVDSDNYLVTTPGGSSIDNMIAAQNIRFLNCKAFVPGHSDHYMIYSTIIVLA